MYTRVYLQCNYITYSKIHVIYAMYCTVYTLYFYYYVYCAFIVHCTVYTEVNPEVNQDNY